MPWDKEPGKVPSKIPRVKCIFTINKAADSTLSYEAEAEVKILMSDNTDRIRQIPTLEAHLTAQQITQIRTFMQTMLTKAETEIL